MYRLMVDLLVWSSRFKFSGWSRSARLFIVNDIVWAVMFPLTALAGLAVVDILVRFFAFDLPFELPFLVMGLEVGRLTVLFFGSNIVFEVVEIASVLVVDLLGIVLEVEVVWDKGGSVTIGWRTVKNLVVVSIRGSTASGSSMFVKLGVGVVSSSMFSLIPSSSVTKDWEVAEPVMVLKFPIGFMKLSNTKRSRCITIQSRSVLHMASVINYKIFFVLFYWVK